MGNKKALLYLAAGIVCAALVVVLAQKRLLGGGVEQVQKSEPEAEILLACQQIEFGSPLIVKEGDVQGNVAFVKWPKDRVPEGAFTDPEELKQKKLVALASFVRHEPILRGQTIDEHDFVDEDVYYLARVNVSREEISSGLLRAGMKVDVIQNYKEFMRCVQIYSVGPPKYKVRDLPQQNKKEEKVPDHVYLLVKKEHRIQFLQAQQKGELKLLPTRYTCEGAPVLVSEQETVGAKVARQLLAQGQERMAGGDFEGAEQVFAEVLDRYSDMTDLAAKARKGVKTCQQVLAERAYSQAQDALIGGDISRCLELLASIETDHPLAEDTLGKAQKLSSLASARLKGANYEELLRAIEEKIAGGDFEGAATLLERIENEFQDWVPEGDTPKPADALKDLKGKLRQAEAEFKRARTLFQLFMRNKDYEKAVEKFKQIEKRFPENSFIPEARESLQRQGLLE